MCSIQYISYTNKHHMKKLALLFIAAFGISFSGFAQDINFDDLVRLRASTFPAFETYAHDKGYKMDHVGWNYNCATFRKGTSMISYCEMLNKGMKSHCLPSVRYETSSRTEYEKIKAGVEARTKYVKTKMHRSDNENYMEHIYSSDEVTVYMYDIAHDYCCKPRYVIEIYSIYSGR